MEEIFPVASGLVIGSILGWLRPSLRKRIGVVLAVVFGVIATVVSGEFRISWTYLFIDIPLVGISAAVGLIATQHLRLKLVRES